MSFDSNRTAFYPYLHSHISCNLVLNKKVPGTGLCLGTLSQKISESGAMYSGLNISPTTVNLVKYRLEQNELPGNVYEGNILEAPFEDNSFDFIIAIGCYHHTGNLQKALDETFRMLKNDGIAVIMVYSAYSYRQWLSNTKKTMSRFCKEYLCNKSLVSSNESENVRKLYDATSAGKFSPEAVLTSRRQFMEMAKNFKSVRITGENIEDKYFFKYFGRKTSSRLFGNLLGLDIYCTCVK